MNLTRLESPSPKKYWSKKEICVQRKFWDKKKFWSDKFWVQNYCGSKKNSRSKKSLGLEKILGQKFFWVLIIKSSIKGRLQTKAEGCLSSQVVFHWRLSSIKGRLPSKVVFHLYFPIFSRFFQFFNIFFRFFISRHTNKLDRTLILRLRSWSCPFESYLVNRYIVLLYFINSTDT